MMRELYPDGYEKISLAASPVSVEVSLDDVQRLREAIVETTLIGWARDVRSYDAQEAVDGNLTKSYMVFTGAKNRSIPSPDLINDRSIFLGMFVRQFKDERWHAGVTFNRMHRREHDMAEERLRTYVRVVCWGDRIVEATRTVKLARSESPFALAALGTPPKYKRLGFTTPLTPVDCDTVADRISRHTKRITIERRNNH